MLILKKVIAILRVHLITTTGFIFAYLVFFLNCNTNENRISFEMQFSAAMILPSDTSIRWGDTVLMKVKIPTENLPSIDRFLWSEDNVLFDTTITPSKSFIWDSSQIGPHSIFLKILNKNGISSTAKQTRVNVLLGPKVVLAGDSIAFVNDTINVKANVFDPNSNIASYSWALDSLKFSTSTDSIKRVFWTPKDSGLHTVYCRVTDNDNLISPISKTQISIRLQQPSLTITTPDTTVFIGDTVGFSANAKDKNDVPFQYLWSTDGAIYNTTSGPSFKVIFDSTDIGVKTVYAMIKDDLERVSPIQIITLTVTMPNEVETEDIPSLTKSYIRGLRTYTDTAQLRNQILSIFHGSRRHLFDQIPVQLDSIEELFILCNILSHKTAPYGYCIETYNVWDLLNSPTLKCDAYAAVAAQLFRIAIGPEFDSSFAFWGNTNENINLNHCMPFIVRNNRSILVDPTYGIIGFVSRDELLAGNLVSPDSIFSFYSYLNDPMQPAFMTNSYWTYRNALMNGLYQSANTFIQYYYIGFDWCILNQ